MATKIQPFRPFSYGQRERDFSGAIHQRVVAGVHDRRRRMISDQNSLAYRHGGEWSSSHNPVTQEFSRFQSARVEASIPFEHIVDHRLNAISEYVDRMVEGLERSFMRTLFGLIDATTEKTGNIVQSSGNPAQDFLDVLSKVETGVDRYGRPDMPSIFAAPNTGERLLREIEAQPEEFQRRVEELKAEKEKSATASEVHRITRFRW